MSERVFLCRMDELRDGGARGFDPFGAGQDSVLVVRRGARLHGWRDACPHYGTTPLAWRKDAYLNADGSRIVCAAHGAQFDVETGACTLGPCLGQALRRVELLLDLHGDVRIRLSDLEGEAEHGVD